VQHKLIILAGSSSGAGKSTLSELLFDQFTRHHIPTRWIYEEDILHLEAFTPVVQAFQHGQGDGIEAVLAATTHFVHDSLTTDVVTITDSIFPCFTWLFAAGYSHARIADFSLRLAQLLHPLRPLIIYLNSDVATSLNRAVAQRGTVWLDDLIATMQTYTYCQTHPVRDISDVVAFFMATNQLSVDLLTNEPHTTLVLDTTTTPIDQLATVLLQHFSVSKLTALPKPTSHELQPYVGVYIPRDTTTAVPPLEIRLVDTDLRINSYWPKGCRLIPEGAARFRLQSTNRQVAFETSAPMEPRWLVYTYGGRAYFYDKVSES
jgi:hypothetical protein